MTSTRCWYQQQSVAPLRIALDTVIDRIESLSTSG
jgi:hypothetical protein